MTLHTAALVALTGAALGVAAWAWSSPGPTRITGLATVVDGDTIRVNGQRIRLRTVDAPELGTDAGERARRLMVQLADHRVVVCLSKRSDRYGRPVADCVVERIDIGEAMIASGLAGRWRGER